MAYDKKKLKKEIGTFLKQYQRKSGRNAPDPNDRSYNRKIEQAIKRMKPGEFHEILYEEDIENERK